MVNFLIEPIIISKCFSPWFPLAAGKLSGPDSPFGHLVAELKATPSQVALPWLRRRALNM
jgi:pyridoxine 4-dehydrogenase